LVVLVAVVAANACLYFFHYLPRTSLVSTNYPGLKKKAGNTLDLEKKGYIFSPNSTSPTPTGDPDQGVDASRDHDPGQMNETSGQMLDLPGNNSGTPTDVLQTGGTYVFNGSTSHVPVPDDDSLDPQENDTTLTARVLVNGASLDDDSYDVVRKGFVDTPGGDYKMEIKRTADPTVGKLHCFFRGTEASVYKVANRDIVDGNWHTLQCVKTANSVVARVDGRSFTKAGSAGSIANESIVMVGAKKAEPFDDMFDGSMDFVSIDIAQPDVAR
jgi:hypothetical protein